MVDLIVDGLGIAAGCGARGGAGPDQVAEFAGGPVAVFPVGMVAGPLGDRGEGDSQLAQQFGQLGLLVLVWSGAGGFGSPGMLSAGAAVRDGLAVFAEDRHAPPGPGVPGGGCDEVAGGVGADEAEAADFGGCAGPAD